MSDKYMREVLLTRDPQTLPGAGAQQALDVGNDGQLAPGESANLRLILGLVSKKKFVMSVELYGVGVGSDGVGPVACLDGVAVGTDRVGLVPGGDAGAQDVDAVICNPLETKTSRSSGRPIATGYTPDGRLILVVYEEIDECTVYPVTAYEVEG